MERLYFGLPTILIAQNEVHEPLVDKWVNLGCAIKSHNCIKVIEKKILYMIKNKEIRKELIKNGKSILVIKSIPYQINKSVLVERIAQLAREKKIEGISDIRDESNREGIRVVIELRRGVEGETIRRQLYKLTSIESSFGFNTLAIVENKPKIFNLKEFISEFVKFREETVIKRIKFDLKKAEDRAHVLIGLATAVENIDEVIKIIKNSKDTDNAKKNLLSKKWKVKKSIKLIALIEKKKNFSSYQLSETQVNSILELRLQKLTAYGIGEIELEINKLSSLILEYNKLLSSKKELYKLIASELADIKSKFSVPRRTKIIDAVLNYSVEETIQKESIVINITNQGYIKRSRLENLKSQKRGGTGKQGIVTRDEDFVVQIFSANTHTPVVFFSSEGLAYKMKAWKIPEGSSSSKGKSLFNILPLKSHQTISSIMPLPEDENEWKKLLVIFVTANGNVRKNSLDDLSNINANGKIAMKLESNDKIVGVRICRDDQDIMLSTKSGKCIRFMAKKLRLFKGRSSKGIRGIQLTDKDKVISLSILDNPKIDNKTIKKDERIKHGLNKFILSITENGYGKRTSFMDYRVTNRGGKGIIGIVNSPRNGNVASSLVVEENDEIILSTDKGSVMRCAVKEIRIAGRNTQGVRIKKLSGSEKVVSVIKIEDNLQQT